MTSLIILSLLVHDSRRVVWLIEASDDPNRSNLANAHDFDAQLVRLHSGDRDGGFLGA
ncbi:hypothetical protein [Bradyrhizobium japonicum]|uniref:hypothetical protein n=1 Tax=Bradyrhizobium japonicum TaxID=375 RepID=UPI001CB6CF30|nr:hypothetical protein [Bradyrhizobium japonicum]